MRVGEGLQAMLRRTPGAVVFARRMKGLFDRLVGLVVLFLQGQPRVASLGPALARDGRLTAYRIALVWQKATTDGGAGGSSLAPITASRVHPGARSHGHHEEGGRSLCPVVASLPRGCTGVECRGVQGRWLVRCGHLRVAEHHAALVHKPIAIACSVATGLCLAQAAATICQ